jgi:Uma2 family endonuclease
VWVVYPDEQQVVVHSPGQPAQIVNIDGVLDGGDVLPGFTLPLRDIFAR